MTADLAAAFPSSALVLEQVEEAAGLALRSILVEGPATALADTEVTQVALFAHAAMLLDILRKEHAGISKALCGEGGGSIGGAVLAGHSVGEFAALHAAGRLPLEKAARLLRLRGSSMAAAGCTAAQLEPVKMVACLPTSAADAALAAQEAAAAVAPGLVVEVSSVNSRRQVVLAGHASAVDRAVDGLRAAGHCRRALPLPVSAPFHTSLMSSAAEALATALEVPEAALAELRLRHRRPRAGNHGSTPESHCSKEQQPQAHTAAANGPVLVHCHDGSASEPTVAWETLRRRLVEQVVQPVRWDLVSATIARQIDSAGSADKTGTKPLVLELGPGSTLCGLGRDNAAPAGARFLPLGTAEQLQAFLREARDR